LLRTGKLYQTHTNTLPERDGGMSSPQRWKRAEREIAAPLGGAQIPNNGYGQPDVIAGRVPT